MYSIYCILYNVWYLQSFYVYMDVWYNTFHELRYFYIIILVPVNYVYYVICDIICDTLIQTYSDTY